jgi:colanic acid/amylovoran biosynthesis glycosyltransferase
VAWKNMGAIEQTGMKHVVTFYGYDVNCLPSQDQRWHERYRNLFEQADLVLCEGPHMMKCVRALGCPEHKVRVHPLGVRTDEITFKPRLWNSTEPLCVLIAASFQEKKGIPYALEALGKIQSEVPLKITIIGDSNSESKSQAEKENILAVIEKYHLHTKVRMMGYQPHEILLKEAYRNHIFLSPSITASDGDTEGGAPVSIIEMAATGMPVVSTLHCDIPEVIQNGTTGFLAEERDVEKLLSHLRWLVGHPSRWLEILKAGRAHVEAKYDVGKQGRGLAENYKELVQS